MPTAIVIVIVVALGLIAAVMFALAVRHGARRRRAALRQRFGPEYERALESRGSMPRADRELMARAKRVDRLHLHELGEEERARFSARWDEVQRHFLDEPGQATQDADDLINDLMSARGYPTEDFDRRVADLSVDHADAVQHYRAARLLVIDGGDDGQNATENLRQAILHYRALVADLLRNTTDSDERRPQ